MSSTPDKNSTRSTTFPVGPAGRRELRRALLTATDPGETIQSFQQSHSLHAMMARAFHTVPGHTATQEDVVEPLDTDSVLTFLSHLGVSQHEVHRRIGDALRTQLEDEIRKVQGTEALLNLLKSCWSYSTSIPELRPVLWAVLKQLGPQTPLPVLELLGERDNKTGEIKHAEVWHPLPPLLKRLVWEADWDRRVGLKEPDGPQEYHVLLESTLFGEKVKPIIRDYCGQSVLVVAADRPFVGSLRERRMVTTQRRAAKGQAADLSKPVSQLRKLLAGGETPAYRPKLLQAILKILMAKHGKKTDQQLVGGAAHLHCTLVADILLSGPLPKSYQHVLTLARTLDESVKEGIISDAHIAQVQASLRHIYPIDAIATESIPSSIESAAVPRSPFGAQRVVKGPLEKILRSALAAMMEADPQSLFLNPVSDVIAPGYSKVILEPMCMKLMESKVGNYRSLEEWERDVHLMFRNCINYNIGNEGQWFRGEARRQGSVFRENIFPQAKRHYQTAIGKLGGGTEVRKRDSSSVEVTPLPASKFKKRKKDNQAISMPALAAMLLSEPFAVRLLLDRVLRSLRIDTSRGSSVPASHRLVPSLLQLLNIANRSPQFCATQGKRFTIPDAGLLLVPETDGPNATIPFLSLRRCMPVVTKLILESDLDRRLANGGDLHEALRSLPSRGSTLSQDVWDGSYNLDVCGAGKMESVRRATVFLSLIQALLRHKSKLPRAARDSVLVSWKRWLRRGGSDDTTRGSTTSGVHECFVLLLNEWAALGNLLLPRDLLLKLSKEAIEIVDSTETSPDREFACLWRSTGDDADTFQPVKEQYTRLLGYLKSEQADAWKKELEATEMNASKGIGREGLNEAAATKEASAVAMEVTTTNIFASGKEGSTETPPSADASTPDALSTQDAAEGEQ